MKHTNIRNIQNCLSRDQYSSRHFPPDQTLLASPGVIDASLAGNPNILQHVLVLKIIMNSYPIFFAVNNRDLWIFAACILISILFCHILFLIYFLFLRFVLFVLFAEGWGPFGPPALCKYRHKHKPKNTIHPIVT